MARGQGVPRKVHRYQNWLSILDEFDVQFLLLDTKRDGDLFRLVRSRSDWIVDITEGERVLLTRAPVLDGVPAAPNVRSSRPVVAGPSSSSRSQMGETEPGSLEG